jgi:hypothetical protein
MLQPFTIAPRTGGHAFLTLSQWLPIHACISAAPEPKRSQEHVERDRVSHATPPKLFNTLSRTLLRHRTSGHYVNI